MVNSLNTTCDTRKNKINKSTNVSHNFLKCKMHKKLQIPHVPPETIRNALRKLYKEQHIWRLWTGSRNAVWTSASVSEQRKQNTSHFRVTSVNTDNFRSQSRRVQTQRFTIRLDRLLCFWHAWVEISLSKWQLLKTLLSVPD